MFKKKLFKKKLKPKVQNDKESPTTGDMDYDVIDPKSNFGPSRYTPLLPDTPIPKSLLKNAGKIFSKDAIVDLPLQHVASNRRMEDLDDDEYGYTTGSDIYKLKKKDTTWEEAFVDAHEFLPYKKDSHSSMLSKFFFSPRENYETLSIDKICLEMTSASTEVQQDLLKYIAACLLPDLKQNNKIVEIFNLLSCKNKSVRNLCVNEMTEIIMDADQGKFSRDEMMMLYETGTIQLFTVISETKKTFSIFHPLIQLGIMFNCFIYLRAIEAVEDWIPCIQNVASAIQSKKKRVMERNDPDVIIFAKMAKCIFDLEDVDLDESLLMEEDVNDFLPPFNREDSDICIEGFAALYHTGNLVLRQQSKFNSGVQKIANLSSFMDGCNDNGMMKWYHRLLDLFIVHILQREHSDVKLEILEKGEDQLFLTLNRECHFAESFSTSHCLLFHHNERIQSKYREIGKRRGIVNSKTVTEDHIQSILNKCGLVFDTSSTVLPLNIGFERKQCTFCNVDASITCIFEVEPDEPKDVDMYDNTATTFSTRESSLRKERLENEMEVLKEIETKDMHRNVARLLAFNQSSPKFYIKERLPGDNLQRRLLEVREKGKVIPIADLIGIIVQAVQAIIYVHSSGCLVRDITTASFGCTVTENGYFLKLKNFEMAAKPSDFPSGGIVTGLIDLDFNGVCTRWAAPESLLEGRYSIYSDVWSVNILADEILNYAAWPYSDISDADIDDMIINIVFTHLKPQGFNRPRRVQGLILEGLASEPDQRLKLEALRERLLEISDNVSGGESYSTYDTYSGVEGTHAKVYDIPSLTERQIKANSVFERGIPPSIQRYRELDEDPMSVFASEAAEYNERLRAQDGIPLTEISSDEYYKIESEDRINMMKVMEKVSDDFLKFTYNRLKEIDSRKMCVEPWPPTTSISADGFKQIHYKFPRSTHLLDIVLHKERGETIGPYIELLYELANHIDSFHSAGWIFRCLRAKNVWILETKKREQTIVVPKFGKYRVIASSDFDIHLEQIKVERPEEADGIQWLPIESIKAGLYSKESDVYAFGMITWEVMSAFGQEGVVYDQDEERELNCIPFNYQQSENILQHLIEGYIPEKNVKCPDWFYRDVTRPCLLHQKIDRPSMKTIVQILGTRLDKSLPKQILMAPPQPPPDQLSQSDRKPQNVEMYEDIYDYDEFDISTDLSQSCIEESKTTEKDGDSTVFPPPQTRRPPPPPPVSYYNTKESKSQGEVKRSLPPPPPRPKPKDDKGKEAEVRLSPENKRKGADKTLSKGDSNDSIPPVPRRPPPLHDNDESIPPVPRRPPTLPDSDDSIPPVPRRPIPLPSQENQKESAETTDEKSCKTLPLPKIPQSDESESVDVEERSAQTVPPKTQTRHSNAYQNVKEQKSFQINKAKFPPLPPKPEGTKNTFDGTNPEPPRTPHTSGHKNDTSPPPPPPLRRDNQLKSENPRTCVDNVRDFDKDSIHKSSDFAESASIMSQGSMGETCKGSDYVSKTSTQNLGDTERGSDFDRTSESGVAHRISDNLTDTERGSDFYGKLPAMKTKPKILPKPSKSRPQPTFYVGEEDSSEQMRKVDEVKRDECDTAKQSNPVYVNETETNTKPVVPPRKPLDK
ncbi:uncharacterized protein LOC125672347 isoform X2 [Ostrea edulis]|uniref:uncharacterized protein LOC125672347 isoform X2 n=1 Tax=Ostrea edulis TaxID=37623 RepID=UPI0024AFE469|nr:uncharacterized protein LOC125672347 isoform X2 [Ostrea edulis]